MKLNIYHTSVSNKMKCLIYNNTLKNDPLTLKSESGRR